MALAPVGGVILTGHRDQGRDVGLLKAAARDRHDARLFVREVNLVGIAYACEGWRWWFATGFLSRVALLGHLQHLHKQARQLTQKPTVKGGKGVVIGVGVGGDEALLEKTPVA